MVARVKVLVPAIVIVVALCGAARVRRRPRVQRNGVGARKRLRIRHQRGDFTG